MSFFYTRHKHVFSDLKLEVLRAVYCHTKYWSADNLAAPVWRLFWFDRPGCHIQFEKELVKPDGKSLYLIPPGVSFGGWQEEPLEEFHIIFNFSPTMIELAKPCYQFAADQHFEEWLGKLPNDNQALHQPLMTINAMHVLSNCLQQIPKHDWQLQTPEARILRVIRAMSMQLRHPLNNRELAALVEMSESAFIRYFSQQLGEAPQKYQTRLRLEQAQRLLITTALPLDDIALGCGYVDRSHLSRQFKRFCQESPGAYRERLSNMGD